RGADRGRLGGAAYHVHRPGGAGLRRGPADGRRLRHRPPRAGHAGRRCRRRQRRGGRHAVGGGQHAGARRPLRVDRHRVRGGDPRRHRAGAGQSRRRPAGGHAVRGDLGAVVGHGHAAGGVPGDRAGATAAPPRAVHRRHRAAPALAAAAASAGGGPMIRRGLIGFPLVLVGLGALAVFRDQLGMTLFYLTLLYTMFFWVAQATSWNILSGYSGYFSFGQGAFVGVGVYTTAVLTAKHGWSFYATVPVAALLSALVGLGIGAVAFRLATFRGATFALLTLAVPFILAAAARLTRAIDGGAGVLVEVPQLPGQLRFQEFLYLVMLVVAGLAVAAAYFIYHSRFGWALAAIRDHEDVAEGL